MCTGPAVLSPGFQDGFRHVTLGHLSGHLCYKRTRLFQRSLKTVIPCTCPRMGMSSQGPPITLPCCLGPWGPRWTEGQGAGSARRPSWTLELYRGSADACPLPPHDRRVTPLWGKGDPTWLLSQHPASPLPSRVSGHPRPRGLGWPRDRGFTFAPPPTPTEGAARHSR